MKINDTEFFVMQAVAMRLSEKDALVWIKKNGKSLKRAQFYRLKKKILSKRVQRHNEFDVRALITEIHEKIDQTETLLNMSFQNVLKEKDPLKNQKIIESIVRILPFSSTIYEDILLLKGEFKDMKHPAPNSGLFCFPWH